MIRDGSHDDPKKYDTREIKKLENKEKVETGKDKML